MATTGSLTGLSSPPGSGLAVGTGTGKYGAVSNPQDTTAGAPFSFSDLVNWLNTPFTNAMSPAYLFLVVGTILVAIILWNLILYHIRIAAETIV